MVRLDMKEYIGRKYNMLTIIKEVEDSRKGRYVFVECECGNKKRVNFHRLKHGSVKSCGCLHLKNTPRKHGLWKHPLYNIWKAMKDRCLNPKSKDYKDYGGRGIVMNPEWVDVKKYIDDIEGALGERPNGMTIDRIDNDKGYFIDNLRYANTSQQNVNKRTHNKLGSSFKNISNSKGRSGFEVTMQRLGHKRYEYFNNIDDAIKIRDKWLNEYNSNPKEWIKNTINNTYKEML